MLRSLTAFSLIILSFGPAHASDYPTLPKGLGRDVMVRVCAQCHSPELAAQQNLDPAGWKALVDQMANNGAQASDVEFSIITKYLAASFPPNQTEQRLQAQKAMRSTPTTRGKEGTLKGHPRVHPKVYPTRRAVRTSSK